MEAAHSWVQATENYRGWTGSEFTRLGDRPTPVTCGLRTRPEDKQVVHTLSRRGAPSTNTRTRCRFGRNRRRVFTAEWLTEWPVDGRLPQIAHWRAMTRPP